MVIVKADKQGTLQPLIAACQEPFLDEEDPENREKMTHVQVIDSGIGPITKADILLAETTGATLQCFRVKPPAKQHKDMLKRLKVEINTFDVYFDFLRNLGLKVR
mmetsp:Transcript_11359/g.15730  ORF Transcript_11359/g.15730 Transcript_11359/m.15730 type:complete len:105 (+) Transcript_11359:87-401(+)